MDTSKEKAGLADVAIGQASAAFKKNQAQIKKTIGAIDLGSIRDMKTQDKVPNQKWAVVKSGFLGALLFERQIFDTKLEAQKRASELRGLQFVVEAY